jgi:hypothetical protein
VANEVGQQRSTAVEIAFLLFVLAPVTGAILSGPIVGGTLLTLAVTDSILMLIGVAG